MTERDDIELLIAYRHGGDERAFAALVARHGRWIAAVARRRLGDAHLADDAAQSAFVVLATRADELIASRGNGAGGGSLAAWLFHVTHFTCGRLRRAGARRAGHERAAGADRLRDVAAYVADADANEGDADASLAARLEEAVARLGPGDRDLVVRRHYRGQSFAAIAAATGLTAEAARKRVSRALAEVGDGMRRGGGVPPDVFPKLVGRASTPVRWTVRKTKERIAMSWDFTQPAPSQGGHQMISAEFVVSDVEANLAFFELLGFPRRWTDAPDAAGRMPRASLTAGALGKIWIRRPHDGEQIRPSPTAKPFFWIDGGPDSLVAFRARLADAGTPATPIVDEHGLPNFTVTSPDGYPIAFFTAYVAPGAPPVVLMK